MSRLRVNVNHIEDAGDRWHLKIQVTRAKRVFEALIPKDAGMLEVDVFLGQVRDNIKQKLGDKNR